MKKVFLFLMTILLSLSMQAKVGYLSGNDFAEDATYQPEAQAKAWFQTTYPTGTVIAWNDFVNTGIPADITTLWINIDRNGSNWAATGWDNQTLKDKVGTFVKNGGQLFVTSHAVLLANLCGRGTEGLAIENWDSGWSKGSDIWQANTNMCERDNSSHAIFTDLVGGDKKFDLVGADMRTDHNVMWGNINEAEQNCVRLATWGQETNCDHAGIVEFLPKGEYQGHIIACGLAAYQWGKTNSKIANVEKLTENALTYLESLNEPEPEPEPEPVIEPDPAADMAYLLPEELATLKTSQLAEYNAAKWFQDEYIGEGKPGKFVTKDQISGLYAAGIRVLWVHTDRTGIETSYANDYKEALAAYAKAGGNVLLTKQATYLAHSMGRIGFAPEFAATGSFEGTKRSIRTVSIHDFNSSNHPIYGEEDGELMKRYDNEKRIYFVGEGTSNTLYRYCGWQDLHKNAEKSGKAGNGEKTCRTDFETVWQCELLGIRGDIGDYCFSDIVYFKKGTGAYADWKGHILAIGAASYLWTNGTNIEQKNVAKLTKNAISYLSTDLDHVFYTRATTVGRYGTICLERTPETIEGATFFAPVEIVNNSSEQIIGINLDEVVAPEAGVGYYFLAEAAELKVTMDANETALTAPVENNAKTHGMHGTFVGGITVENTANELILNSNKLWYGTNNTVGEHRAWIKVNELQEWIDANGTPAPAPGRRRVTMAVDHTNVTTAVENSELQSGETLKLMQNGQIYILRSGACYTIDGRLVK